MATTIASWRANGLTSGVACLTPGSYAADAVIDVEDMGLTLTSASGPGDVNIRLARLHFTGNVSDLLIYNVSIMGLGQATIVADSFRQFEATGVSFTSSCPAVTMSRGISASIVNCDFHDNGGITSGVALRIDGGEVSIYNTSFTRNTAGGSNPGGSGIIYGSALSMNVDECVFADNIATGGAVVDFSASEMRIQGSVFSNNQGGGLPVATTIGGAVFFSGGSLSVVNSNFTDSNTGCAGGAVAGKGDMLVSQNTYYTGNKISNPSCPVSKYGGGAIFWTGPVSLAGNVFKGNSPNDVVLDSDQ